MTKEKSSLYLLNESPLVLQPTLAAAIGLNEALVIQQLHYWLGKSEHIKENIRWVYNRYIDWQKQFPFWSISTVQRVFENLEEKNLIISMNSSPNSSRKTTNRTKWYTINYELLERKIEEYLKETGKIEDKTDKADLIEEDNEADHGKLIHKEKNSAEAKKLTSEKEKPADPKNKNSNSPSCQVGTMEPVNLPFPLCQVDMMHNSNLTSSYTENTTENIYIYNSQSVNQSTKGKNEKMTDGRTEEVHLETLKEILKKCDIHKNFIPQMADAIEVAIEELYFNSSFAKERLNRPIELVRENLHLLDADTIKYAVIKMKSAAARGTQISSPARYLMSCIYSAISEYSTSIMCEVEQQSYRDYVAACRETIGDEVEDGNDVAGVDNDEAKFKQLEDSHKMPMLCDESDNKIALPLKRLYERMGEISYNSFIRPLGLISKTDSSVKIKANEEFTLNIIEYRYLKLIKEEFEKEGISEVIITA